MPRIVREEHVRIRERVEVGGEKVPAVAASYGCTPANIYAILSKLRRSDDALAAPLPLIPEEGPAADFIQEKQVDPLTSAPLEPAAMPALLPRKPVPPQPAASSELLAGPGATRPASQVRSPSASARGACSGYALLMRAHDGEKAVNPFRSLDELLAAAKPILRSAARSSEPVWFSIQPVDLDALEDAL